jgi:hypothetical protein
MLAIGLIIGTIWLTCSAAMVWWVRSDAIDEYPRLHSLMMRSLLVLFAPIPVLILIGYGLYATVGVQMIAFVADARRRLQHLFAR